MTGPVRSSRLPADLAPNRLAAAVARARASGRSVADLTESNPTRVDLPYPADLLAYVNLIGGQDELAFDLFEEVGLGENSDRFPFFVEHRKRLEVRGGGYILPAMT